MQAFQTANFDDIAADVRFVYGEFKDLVKQTGAAKILHFKHPGLFVMWDTAIRKRYGIPNKGSPDEYVRFLKLMQTEFAYLQWSREDKTLPKAIDEYNYVVTDESGN